MSRDHFRENVRRMRQIQRKCREREEESVQPVKALWKSEKYKDVQSRIKTDIEVFDTCLCNSTCYLLFYIHILYSWAQMYVMIVYSTCI